MLTIKLVQQNSKNFNIVFFGHRKFSEFSELRKVQNYLDLENIHILQNLENFQDKSQLRNYQIGWDLEIFESSGL